MKSNVSSKGFQEMWCESANICDTGDLRHFDPKDFTVQKGNESQAEVPKYVITCSELFKKKKYQTGSSLIYLTGKPLRIRFCTLTGGVPQGCILSPILLPIYSSP